MFKQRARGVTDYLLIDPLFGVKEMKYIPNDIEDIKSLGIEMFDYAREYLPDVPVYIMDRSDGKIRFFDTLFARGARGVIEIGKNAKK